MLGFRRGAGHGHSSGYLSVVETPSPSPLLGPWALMQASESGAEIWGLCSRRDQYCLLPTLSTASCDVGMDDGRGGGGLPSLPSPIAGRPTHSGFEPHTMQRAQVRQLPE